jgi:hypothetical protein
MWNALLATHRQTPSISNRWSDMSQRTVVKGLYYQFLHPFHVRNVRPWNGRCIKIVESRKAFCEWLLQREAASPTFLSRELLLEGACFTRNGILTIGDQQTWADENPHSFEETQFRQSLQ